VSAPPHRIGPNPGFPVDADAERTLLARYETLGVERSTLTRATEEFESIELDRFDGDEISVADEPTRVEADLSHLSMAMDMHDELGRGGMAEVHAATQRTLRRQVAVKSLREDQQTPEHARQLLSEARILAALEHPAIVPVYLLATDAMGSPVIVMRNVDGTLWRHFVDEHGELRTPDGVPGDPLRWHVRVLATICDAVHHAHGIGVLHRDLKLRNIVITDNGDPYLLDWGLAATLDKDSDLDLPYARDEQQLRGTPGYLAPEMAAVNGAAFGPWTDVYLLGGCLHALLTGWPRHRGRTVIEQLASAYASRPATYEKHVPDSLAAIANTATARDPSDRYPTAAAMRVALLNWLDGERVASAVAVERVALAGEQATVRGEAESVRAEQATVWAEREKNKREQSEITRQRDGLRQEQRALRKERMALLAQREDGSAISSERIRRSRVLVVLALAVLLLGTLVVGQLAPVGLTRPSLLLLLFGELLGGLLALVALIPRR